MAVLPYGRAGQIAEELGFAPSVVYRAIHRRRTDSLALRERLQQEGISMEEPSYQERRPRSDNPGVSRQRQEQRRNWERNAARQMVHRAIAAGKMPPAWVYHCADCGAKAEEYDHFLGYTVSYAYSVMPVCRPCHYQREVKRRYWRARSEA